jgi:hypothetical protein
LSDETDKVESFENVKFFLKKLQNFLNGNSCQLDIQRNRKGQDHSDPNTTVNTMLDLEYNVGDVKEELLSLKTSDYIKTVKDRKRPKSSDYWVFLKKIKEKDVYIKLKIHSVNKIHLMSFHYAAFVVEDKPYK